MGFNRENYARIKGEYEGKYLRAIEDAQFRRAEIHSKLPEIAKIDGELASSGMRIFEASVSGDRAMVDRINEENRALLKKRADILAAAGFPANYTEVRYECAECGDTGTVDYRMCKCMKNKLIKAGLESSGMYELIEAQSFENFELKYYSGDALPRMKTILDITKKYAEDFEAEKSGSILMMGGTGLGKTHLSSAMGGVIIEKGNDVCYANAVDMLADFEKEKFGNCPYIDLFVNIQWKRASIFIKYMNANMGWPNKSADYFTAAGYISTQRAIKFGIAWPFYVQPGKPGTGGGKGSAGASRQTSADALHR